jgi:hypothetical protein
MDFINGKQLLYITNYQISLWKPTQKIFVIRNSFVVLQMNLKKKNQIVYRTPVLSHTLRLINC